MAEKEGNNKGRKMAEKEGNNKGGEGSKGKAGSIFPAKKKTVKEMIGKKLVESGSKVFKNDKKKINPGDDEDDEDDD